MINFFRRIRKKLADDNKPLKYMRYAIGEILLVVIGILIALQINNWNEFRKDRKLESDYLKEINWEFKRNKEQFGNLLETHRDVCNTCDKMMTMVPFTKTKWDSLHYYYQQSIVLAPRFNPSSSTIESLINNASIDIIRNDSLRVLLLDWNNLLADWKEEETEATESVMNMRNWTYENVSTDMVSSTNDFATSRLVNFEKLFVFQNLVRLRCLMSKFILEGNTYSERNETLKLMKVMDRVILLSQLEE